MMKILIENGYVDGFVFNKYINGDYIMRSIKPEITVKGMEYLQENNLMKKLGDAAKGLAGMI